ncbi:M24 family metallopeptidase [Candidatus Contubernalis alkaliaceticus]|uniref:M24 family metallopeptidase n=1 Tax=Candidatus Contubernalis alkaliaceticus TaxID=338645 RepID=UPI001F4C37D9|nr:Xaa-Pro peptidase family protein [Candidatus Contubernalis alkalaceticus]UNC92942.1 aminopeptidase P family protein [Candidatus Contubernalis alkalaceticus]
MKKRIDGLKRRMEEKGFDVALLMYPRDVYYYAGTAQPCNLLVTLKEEPILFARRAWDFVQEEATLEDIRPGGSLKEIKKILHSFGVKGGVIGMEEDVLPARLYSKTAEFFEDFRCENISPLIMDQRMIKDLEEIELVKKSAGLFSHIHEVILNNLRPGITEVELATLIWVANRREGHEGLTAHRRWDGYLPGDGIVASGDNMWKISGYAMTVTGVGKSKALPWGSSDRVIQKGDLVMVDIAPSYQGYHGDIARTYVVGQADDRQKEVFGSLLKIMESVLSHIRAGIPVKELYHLAVKIAEEEGYGDYLQGYGSQKGEYIGHGLGLEVDEPPVVGPHADMLLQENMVLAIEPKIIIPQWGAVDLEDTLLVTKEGCEIFSPIDKQLFEV